MIVELPRSAVTTRPRRRFRRRLVVLGANPPLTAATCVRVDGVRTQEAVVFVRPVVDAPVRTGAYYRISGFGA